MTRVLDYVPRLDERNKAHRVSAIRETAPADKAVWWTGGVILNQGQEGSCVGHGVVGEYLASPVRGNAFLTAPVDASGNAEILSAAEAGHRGAVAVYNRAKQIDEWEGVDYDGTSVRAGMLVAREHGWCEGFSWALNLDELRTALHLGPVVIGVEWREDMYETDELGYVTVGGKVVGGHCLVVTGYSPNYRRRGPVFRWRNSWGPTYGLGGNGYVRPDDLAAIVFGSGGEAAVPTGRHL